MQYGEFCYAYMKDPKTWSEAEVMCKAVGGYLAEVHTQQENDVLEKIIFENIHKTIWLGAHDLITEGNWIWAGTGGPVNDTFTFWGPNEPNDTGSREDCMTFNFVHGYWNDDVCVKNMPFVCQKPIESIVVG